MKMDFEKSNFDIEPNESKQEIFGPDFLQEQIRLPEAEYDEKFLKLVNEQILENQEKKIEKLEELPEILREQAFNRYIEGLGLDESEIRGKKILDLGSGEGEFVKYLIEKEITPEAYGIDAGLDESALEDKFKSHLIQGNFEKDLPIKNLDYIVSVGAVSNGIWDGKEVMDIRRIMEKSLASLKENGEIRIFPIQEAAKATPLEGIEKSRQKWNELLAEISKTQEIECKIEPRNIKVTGDNNDIVLESVLTIQKKINIFD
jgi:SAM-dependent methyltransferase